MLVTISLQRTRRYFPAGAFLVFDKYLPLMKALHVDLLSRRHQFSSITDSDATARMVSFTCITLVLPLLCDNAYLILSVILSVCKNSCDEVWQNTSPRDRRPSHSLVGIHTVILHDEYLTLTNVFFVLFHHGYCYHIFIDSFFGMILHPFWVLSV